MPNILKTKRQIILKPLITEKKINGSVILKVHFMTFRHFNTDDKSNDK